MGMSSGGGKPGAVQSEINVTPLIDVLLVLLIIFLVVMPIMMKMETLNVPRKITENEMPDPNASQLNIRVEPSLDVTINDGSKDQTMRLAEVQNFLRPKLDALRAGAEKVVFVDFAPSVPWTHVVSAMDTIRGLATDENHDEIKIALKIKEEVKATGP
ncbi:MAG: biopolymer transporter ExbD [Kofleriaceae bacterium]